MNSYYISPDNWLHILFRLCLALLIGGVIGVERQLRHKPAGLRTHMLVSLGAAMFVLIPLLITTPEEGRDAISRVIQGIAAGVGFLGAGEILRESHDSRPGHIRGLTSAAAIWVCASLGVAAGCGFWQLAIIGTVLSFLILNVLKKLETGISQ